MIFPNGVVKEGSFEFNVFKGPGQLPLQPVPENMRSVSKQVLMQTSGGFYGGPNPQAQP